MEQRCINLGSYNYLGFAEGAGGSTHAAVERACRRYGLALCAPRAELGDTPLHRELEETTARFLGVEVTIYTHTFKWPNREKLDSLRDTRKLSLKTLALFWC